jgi:hypothetical protein
VGTGPVNFTVTRLNTNDRTAVTMDPYQPPQEDASKEIDAVTGRSFLPATPLKTFGLAVIVFPVLGVIDLLVDTLTGVADSDAPISLNPLFLLLGWGVGGYLWFRAFRLWNRTRPMLSSSVYAFITLPVWFFVSGILALPIIMVR